MPFPLHAAARDGDVTGVVSLLDAGNDINQRNVYGQTPLLRACFFNKGGVVEVLLSRGADPNIADNIGRAPLHSAAARGNIGVGRALVAKGAAIDPVINSGYTPTHYACCYGDPLMALWLVSKGASHTAKTNFGETPAEMVNSRTSPEGKEIVRLLSLPYVPRAMRAMPDTVAGVPEDTLRRFRTLLPMDPAVEVTCTEDDAVAVLQGLKPPRVEAIRILVAAWEAHGGVPPASTDGLARTLSLRRFCRPRGDTGVGRAMEIVEPFGQAVVAYL